MALCSSAVDCTFIFLGSLASLYLFYSPFTTIRDIWQAGEVGEHKPDMYLAVLGNCLIWLLYGWVQNNWAVIGINAVGVLFQACYLCVFIRGAADRIIISAVVIGELSLIIVIAGFVILLKDTDESRSTGFGIAGVVSGIIMYFGPLRQTIAAILAGNVLELTNLHVVVASLFSGVFWTIYTSICGYILMGVPNWIGIVFAAFQLGVYARAYYKGNRGAGEEE